MDLFLNFFKKHSFQRPKYPYLFLGGGFWLMSGLDINSIIDQLKQIQQHPVMMLQQKEANYQVELSTYESLQNALSSLKSAMDGLG